MSSDELHDWEEKIPSLTRDASEASFIVGKSMPSKLVSYKPSVLFVTCAPLCARGSPHRFDLELQGYITDLESDSLAKNTRSVRAAEVALVY